MATINCNNKKAQDIRVEKITPKMKEMKETNRLYYIDGID